LMSDLPRESVLTRESTNLRGRYILHTREPSGYS
jgi:hypothetical protein